MTQDELRTFYISQRDKHLEQLMAINARAVFAVLTLVVSILIGFDNIKSLELPTQTGGVVAGFFCLGILLLTTSAVFMSVFHTDNIRKFQRKSKDPVPVEKDDFLIIPPCNWHCPFVYTLVGVIYLVVAVLIPLLHKLLTGYCVHIKSV